MKVYEFSRYEDRSEQKMRGYGDFDQWLEGEVTTGQKSDRNIHLCCPFMIRALFLQRVVVANVCAVPCLANMAVKFII